MMERLVPAKVDYRTYLQLDSILASQAPESAKAGVVANDEMLFIIVHQAYELWFKQMLHELDLVDARFGPERVDEDGLLDVTRRLERIVAIQKLIVQQIDILETMTPLDFLDFRDLLSPASGFQSVQFRLIEARLGLESAGRLLFDEHPMESRLHPEDRDRLGAYADRPTLHARLDRWLARTPFVAAGDYAFDSAFREAVRANLAREAALVREGEHLDDARRGAELAAIEKALERFKAIFEPGAVKDAWRLSPDAVRAALFITLYRDAPALQLPWRLLSSLMDIDEAMAIWRFRHALMVERMIGVKVGTGGSSGHGYLRRTADAHRIFGDLFHLSTYLIPRAAIPPLPVDISRRMGFVYAAGAADAADTAV